MHALGFAFTRCRNEQQRRSHPLRKDSRGSIGKGWRT
jgi:hypothetical protein